MAATIVGASPSFGNTFKNTWSLFDLDITYLTSNRDSLAVPTDSDGNNPVFTEANVTFAVENRGANISAEWEISSFTTNNVTITVTDATKLVTVTAIAADTGYFIIKATKTGETTIYRKISVFKVVDGKGWTGGSYNASNGITTFTSDDGLGFVTTDLRGATGADGTNGTDGLGWTNGSYDSGTGIVTFTSDDGLGFTTDDLRGASGGGTVQNVNLSLQPVDEGVTAGDPRGVSAVDLSSKRQIGISAQVASGNYSVISGGFNNTASNTAATISGGSNNNCSGIGSTITGGSSNIISGDASVANGSYNTITNTNDCACGYYNNISGTNSSALGTYNTISDSVVTAIGWGGTSTTNGEIIISNSNSAVQKSIFILERQTNATGSVPMQTLGRGSISGVSSQNIQVANNTAFTGTLDFTGFYSNGYMFRSKFAFSYFCNGVGVITVKQLGQNDADGTKNEFNFLTDGVSTTVNLTPTTNEMIVNVSPGSAVQTNWVAVIEGIIMDI